MMRPLVDYPISTTSEEDSSSSNADSPSCIPNSPPKSAVPLFKGYRSKKTEKYPIIIPDTDEEDGEEKSEIATYEERKRKVKRRLFKLEKEESLPKSLDSGSDESYNRLLCWAEEAIEYRKKMEALQLSLESSQGEQSPMPYIRSDSEKQQSSSGWKQQNRDQSGSQEDNSENEEIKKKMPRKYKRKQIVKVKIEEMDNDEEEKRTGRKSLLKKEKQLVMKLFSKYKGKLPHKIVLQEIHVNAQLAEVVKSLQDHFGDSLSKAIKRIQSSQRTTFRRLEKKTESLGHKTDEDMSDSF